MFMITNLNIAILAILILFIYRVISDINRQLKAENNRARSTGQPSAFNGLSPYRILM